MGDHCAGQAPSNQRVNALWLPRLIAITDVNTFGVDATLDVAERLCSSAIPHSVVIQLREAKLTTEALLNLARELSRVVDAHGQALCVNDRLDVALAVGTPRVHRKPSSADAPYLRSVLEGRFGASWLTQGWHPGDEAPPHGVDAVIASPVMAPRKGRLALGIEGLELAAARVAPVPVLALGGVTAANVPHLRSTRVAGVAVQAAWYRAPERLLASLFIARDE